MADCNKEINKYEVIISRKMVDEFIALTGDDNPIHNSDGTEFFDKPVAPGFLVGTTIGKYPSHNWVIAKVAIKMTGVVYVGETVQIVKRIIKERRNIRYYECDISVDGDIKQKIEFTAVKL
jgi:acyl dehydratase